MYHRVVTSGTAPVRILDLLARATALHGDAVAVESVGSAVTYRTLAARAQAIAERLAAIDVGRESLVGIATRPSIETVVAMVGTLRAGAAFVPLDVTQPPQRLAAMLADSGIRCVLVDRACFGAAPLGKLEQLVLDQREGDPAATPPPVHPAQLAYVVFTSGSTGRPKGVAVSHAGLANLVTQQIEAFAIDATSRVLQFASLAFDAVISEVFTALAAGATLCMEDRAPGADIAELLARRAITVVTLPPSLLAILPADGLPALRTVVSAGEACSQEIIARWARGRRMVNAYGPSEATVCATLKVMASSSDRPTIGVAMAGITTYVLDEALAPAEAGELYLAGDALARGYLGPTGLTAERFVPDPFGAGSTRMYRTGDLVRRLANGELEYRGRIDEQVKIRGFRVEPREVEAAFRGHAGIDDVVVMPRTRAAGGIVLVCFVLSRDGRVTERELHELANERLPQFLRPSEIVIVPAWPVNANGKIDRNALVKLREHRAAALAPARTPTEHALAGIVGSLLDTGTIDLDRGLFEQGGDSITAVRLVIAIGSQLDCKLTTGTLFECPTLRALAARIDTVRVTPSLAMAHTVVRLRDGSAQTPLWLMPPIHGNALCYLRLAQLARRDGRWLGLQTPGLDGEAEPIADFVALAAHHVRTIRTYQPHGPYLFGGWSMGGSLAYEMATQLQRAGEQVSAVLIGATAPSVEHLADARATMKGYETWRMVYFYLRSLAFTLGVPLELDFDELSRLPEHRVFEAFVAVMHRIGPLGMDIDEALARRWMGVVRATLYGFHHHVPSGPFAGRLLLIRTTGANPLIKDRLTRERAVTYSEWNEHVTGPVQERAFQANHYTVMSEPWVRELAPVIDDWLFDEMYK